MSDAQIRGLGRWKSDGFLKVTSLNTIANRVGRLGLFFPFLFQRTLVLRPLPSVVLFGDQVFLVFVVNAILLAVTP